MHERGTHRRDDAQQAAPTYVFRRNGRASARLRQQQRTFAERQPSAEELVGHVTAHGYEVSDAHLTAANDEEEGTLLTLQNATHTQHAQAQHPCAHTCTHDTAAHTLLKMVSPAL